MITPRKLMLVASMSLATLAGCHSDRPHRVGDERPSVTDLDSRDKGLQSKDIVDASDTLTMKILALPDFNGPTRRTMVFSNVENQTTNPHFNYDIFLERLRANIGAQGRDRLFLVENKARVNRLRSEEIEGGTAPDQFGQGAGNANTGAPQTSIQPEWDLNGKVSEMPNRGTSYYLFSFYITNLKTREQIPLIWEVKVKR